MPEREKSSDPGDESGRRRSSIVAWVMVVVMSFALGALVTHFAMLKEPISQYSFQAFFASPFWSTASIALVCFVSESATHTSPSPGTGTMQTAP